MSFNNIMYALKMVNSLLIMTNNNRFTNKGGHMESTKKIQPTTNTAQHTPGPWVNIGRGIYGADGYADNFRKSGREIVHTVGPCDIDEEREANARLIAASPCLLEACKWALDKMNEFKMLLPDNKLSRIIAKAEGR